jgi:hypothetical protein
MSTDQTRDQIAPDHGWVFVAHPLAERTSLPQGSGLGALCRAVIAGHAERSASLARAVVSYEVALRAEFGADGGAGVIQQLRLDWTRFRALVDGRRATSLPAWVSALHAASATNDDLSMLLLGSVQTFLAYYVMALTPLLAPGVHVGETRGHDPTTVSVHTAPGVVTVRKRLRLFRVHGARDVTRAVLEFTATHRRGEGALWHVELLRIGAGLQSVVPG